MATVHRTLELLVAEGVVHAIALPAGRRDVTLHGRCANCGKAAKRAVR